jgi:dTDP-4-dehydrorhamnose reductase
MGSPTWARDLAIALLTLVDRITSGSPAAAGLHYTNAGSCSRYHLARAIFTALGADPDPGASLQHG